MTFIPCPRCGQQLTSETYKCPYCKLPLVDKKYNRIRYEPFREADESISVEEVTEQEEEKPVEEITEDDLPGEAGMPAGNYSSTTWGSPKKTKWIIRAIHGPQLVAMAVIAANQLLLELFSLALRGFNSFGRYSVWVNVFHMLLALWYLVVLVDSLVIFSSSKDNRFDSSKLGFGLLCNIGHLLITCFVLLLIVLDGRDVYFEEWWNIEIPDFLSLHTNPKQYFGVLICAVFWFVLGLLLLKIRLGLASKVEGKKVSLPIVFTSVLLFIFGIPILLLALAMYGLGGIFGAIGSFFGDSVIGLYPFVLGFEFLLMGVNFYIGGAYLLRIRRIQNRVRKTRIMKRRMEFSERS